MPYEIDNETKPMYPDFLIVRKDNILGYVVDVLEPHGSHFKDNFGKAKGLARYYEKQAALSSYGQFGRIQLIREMTDSFGKKRLVRLDMTKTAVRNKVLKCVNNDELDHIFETDGFSD